MRELLWIRRAVEGDATTVNSLFAEAATWLQTIGTDQWAEPWPSKAAQEARTLTDIRSGDTWIVEERSSPIATVTWHSRGNQKLWTARELSDPAVYVSRLVVTRTVAGRNIGGSLMDWSAQQAIQGWGALWIRINVWTTNTALHHYYVRRGFEPYRINNISKKEHPSAALFQKPTRELDSLAAARFTQA